MIELKNKIFAKPMISAFKTRPAPDPDAATSNKRKFLREVLEGLKGIPKSLPSKYFYDKEGDALFQQIMACKEYYLTRCEEEIFCNKTAELAASIAPDKLNFELIELGAGDATKSEYLLQFLYEKNASFTYRPVDISGNMLSILQTRLQSSLPNLPVKPIQGEYLDALSQIASSSTHKVIMFLGGNAGNMPPRAAVHFCNELRSRLNPGDRALIGFDLKKHPRIIWEAYNDQAGLTAMFNLNLLKRINRELEGDFDPDQFEHFESYDPASGACKSYLVSLKDQVIRIGSEHIRFSRDEFIFTEISQKYDMAEITQLSGKSGFECVANFTDSKGWFSSVIWRAV